MLISCYISCYNWDGGGGGGIVKRNRVLHVAVGFLSLASADHYPCNAVGNNIVDYIISVLFGI